MIIRSFHLPPITYSASPTEASLLLHAEEESGINVVSVSMTL
jgi:hypothetical protein